jgi:nucleoside-diphosphate-sugar epimerase
VARQSVAILGATSHIAKGLIYHFLQDGDCRLHLFSRSTLATQTFLRSLGGARDDHCVVHDGYGDFGRHSYDALLNCTGPGTARTLQGDFTVYFSLTEEFDNLALRYLREVRPEALYISFSSGLVYGRGHPEPVDGHSANCLEVNHIAPVDYYAIVRLNAEAKHRAHLNLKIIDLRLFAYFSRFIDLADGYFLTEILTSLLNGTVFVTDNSDMLRDYVHPRDLYDMVRLCFCQRGVNGAFDVCSARPVRKQEVLDYFASRYGLRIERRQGFRHDSATGGKQVYCSRWGAASRIGYQPQFTSMDAITQEAKFLLTDCQS